MVSQSKDPTKIMASNKRFHLERIAQETETKVTAQLLKADRLKITEIKREAKHKALCSNLSIAKERVGDTETSKEI
jgi:hypothetical protein